MADNKTLKKPKLGDEDNDEPIDDKLLLAIEKLNEIQEELEKINDQESDKVLEVEQKYSAIRKPFYDRRKDVIKSIPDFWFTALIGHPALSMLISEEDHKMLKHLKSLEVEDLKNVKAGYSITLIFEPNPFFENTELTKMYSFLEEGTTEITATPIKWKDGMENFKATPNGVTQEKKGKKRALAVESFFSWFSDTQEEFMDMQDEIAEIIKDDLWPNPLAYISMETDEEADDNDEGEKDGDDSEAEDDEEDDEDEENGN